jgi:hypothetical protein
MEYKKNYFEKILFVCHDDKIFFKKKSSVENDFHEKLLQTTS